MDDDLVMLSGSTRRMSVYRMLGPGTFRDLLAPKVGAEATHYTVGDVRVAGLPALLVSGQSEEADVEWTAAVRSLTGVDLGFRSRVAGAALFVAVDDDVYALAFGQGWRLLRESRIDRQFGIDVAVRVLDPDEIRKLTRWALSAKARVDMNMVPGGQGLWAFGLREHAELVRNLAGTARTALTVNLSHVRNRGHHRNFRLTLDCGDALRMPLATEGHSLVADLRELSRMVRQDAVQPRLAPLRWVRRLSPRDDRRDSLDSAVAGLLAQPDAADGEVGIAYPARYYDGPDVQRYRGTIGDFVVDTDELTLDHLRAGIRGHRRDEFLRVLRRSRIEGLDDEGVGMGGAESALHWMAAEIVERDHRFVLLDGDWYELGEQYLAHVRRVVAEAFANRPDWTLPAWRTAPKVDGRWVEGSYNEHVAATDRRFLCLDRRLVKTRVHPHGFEACDLLGPDNELVHVKKVDGRTGSSVLSHLFAQGLVAVESLTDRETWQQFVDVVAQQDRRRAARLGNRPAGLVYAIHRADKPLRPNTLFTFARSALVSASVALHTYGVPLRVAVIS